MVVSDAFRRIREIWGPYSPKIYDGTRLEQHKSEIMTKFGNEVIIADNHFSWGRDHVEQGWAKFYVNYPQPQKESDGSTSTVLTRERQRYNKASRMQELGWNLHSDK